MDISRQVVIASDSDLHGNGGDCHAPAGSQRQCAAAIQQKLIDYVHAGGRLILAGRMCLEDFRHQPCPLLRDALGITSIAGGEPFQPGFIRAFGYEDIPASFVEQYEGSFEEAFATTNDGGVAGFIQSLGKGNVMMFGAALAANTLDDLDILHQMANWMGSQPLFEMSDWADVRLSEGEHGSFLFVNNYQDDPLATTLTSAGKALFGGNPLKVPARRGFILPLEWRLRPGITLHYCTAEVRLVREQDGHVLLGVDPSEFIAEFSLEGYTCASAQPLGSSRWRVNTGDGMLQLERIR